MQPDQFLHFSGAVLSVVAYSAGEVAIAVEGTIHVFSSSHSKFGNEDDSNDRRVSVCLLTGKSIDSIRYDCLQYLRSPDLVRPHSSWCRRSH